MGTRAESDTHPEDVAKRDPALWARATQLVLQLCPPAETVVGLSGVGEVAFRTNLLERQACTAWWEDGQAYGESVALEYAGQTGVLLMEDRLALALVNAVLGVGMPPICGPLSRIERGILEGIVMAVLAKLSPTGTIRVRSGAGTVVAAAPPAGSFGVELLVRWRGEGWRACLLASDELLEQLWGMREARGAELQPWLELASTKVPRAQIAKAEPGDMVVFDETTALPPSGAWPVSVRWRSHAISARWLSDGLVVVAENGSGAQTAEAATHPDHRVAADSRATVAAIGDVSVEMSAGVLCPAVGASRRPSLVVRRGVPLLLRTGTSPWAYGELAEYSGAFAVSITRKLAG